MLGLGVGEAASEPIHLLFAARRIVELLSERGPLLLVFEDVHWADDSLLDLIDYLIAHIHDHPVAFLALARPEFLEVRPTWGAGVIGQTTLTLEPLTTVEAAEVVGTLLAGAAPSTIAKVVATAEGNPLFLEELVAALGEEEGEGDLPATVRAAIAARIDASATRRADRVVACVRDRAVVLERRARGDGRPRRRGRLVGSARGARPRPAPSAQPGRGRRGVRVQARADPRRRIRDAPSRAPA